MFYLRTLQATVLFNIIWNTDCQDKIIYNATSVLIIFDFSLQNKVSSVYICQNSGKTIIKSSLRYLQYHAYDLPSDQKKIKAAHFQRKN